MQLMASSGVGLRTSSVLLIASALAFGPVGFCEKTSDSGEDSAPAPVYQGEIDNSTHQQHHESQVRHIKRQSLVPNIHESNHAHLHNVPPQHKIASRISLPGVSSGSNSGLAPPAAVPRAKAGPSEGPGIVGQQATPQRAPELVLPTPVLCLYRPKHGYSNGHFYYYSWIDVMSKSLELNWLEARNWCRQRCMDLVSLETIKESNHMKTVVQRTGVPYIWTSGRKCDFAGCDRPDLQPVIVNGWFWSGTGVRIPPTDGESTLSAWSATGGLGKRQPDNREYFETKTEESCLAILNNFYGDGVKWHDVACYHKKPWICEDADELLQYAKRVAPHLRII